MKTLKDAKIKSSKEFKEGKSFGARLNLLIKTSKLKKNI